MYHSDDDVMTEYILPESTDPVEEDKTVLFEQGDKRPVKTSNMPVHNHLPPRAYLIRERTSEYIELVVPSVIGRGTYAKTRIGGNLAISRKHAEILSQDSRLFLRDLGSKNGTRIRGELVSSTPVEVYDGDEVCLASEVFHLQVVC